MSYIKSAPEGIDFYTFDTNAMVIDGNIRLSLMCVCGSPSNTTMTSVAFHVRVQPKARFACFTT